MQTPGAISGLLYNAIKSDTTYNGSLLTASPFAHVKT